MEPLQPSFANASPGERQAWQRYGFACALLVVALLLRRLLDPIATDPLPLATVFMAVVATVWFSGWKPATLVCAVGYVAGLWWFLPPRYTFKLWDDGYGWLRTSAYFLSCALTIFLCESIRRAQRRHAAAEAKVRSILDAIHEGFCAVDRSWKITGLNRIAEIAFGPPGQSRLGRSWWEFVPEAKGRPAEAELQRAMRDRVAVQFETNEFIAKAWHLVTAKPAPEGLWIFFEDITANKTQVDQLERLVDDRTAALQRLVSDLESFSYSVAHDLRAPLRTIGGFAEILAKDHAADLDAEGIHFLARIKAAARRMDRLIVDVLDFSRLSRGRPEVRPIDLDETLREIVRSYPAFQPEVADIAIEGELPLVRGNEALLTQCFSNLLHNATKFVEPGVKPRIKITSHVNGQSVRVEVADNGIGIAPEATARIFEPFHREDSRYEGTGIGLAIVRKAVDLLDGRVGVESKIGRGSRFWVELKLANGTDPGSRKDEVPRE